MLAFLLVLAQSWDSRLPVKRLPPAWRGCIATKNNLHIFILKYWSTPHTGPKRQSAKLQQCACVWVCVCECVGVSVSDFRVKPQRPLVRSPKRQAGTGNRHLNCWHDKLKQVRANCSWQYPTAEHPFALEERRGRSPSMCEFLHALILR